MCLSWPWVITSGTFEVASFVKCILTRLSFARTGLLQAFYPMSQFSCIHCPFFWFASAAHQSSFNRRFSVKVYLYLYLSKSNADCCFLGLSCPLSI
jgi:hypothetical protein